MITWKTIGVRYNDADTMPDDNVWIQELMKSESSTNVNKAIDCWFEWHANGCQGTLPFRQFLTSWRLRVARVKAIPSLTWVRDRVKDRDLYKLVFLFHHDVGGELMRSCLNDRKVRVNKIHLRTVTASRERAMDFFQTRSSRKVIVCHDKLARMVDLTAAEDVAFSMLNMFDPDLNWQVMRCITPENKRPKLTAYNIVLLGSRDEEVSEFLMKLAIANAKPLPSFADMTEELNRRKFAADTKDRMVARVAQEKNVTLKRARVIIGRYAVQNIGIGDINVLLKAVITKTDLATAAYILNDHGAARLTDLYPRHYKSVIEKCKEILA